MIFWLTVVVNIGGFLLLATPEGWNTFQSWFNNRMGRVGCFKRPTLPACSMGVFHAGQTQLAIGVGKVAVDRY